KRPTVKLGSSGLKVPPIILGCAVYSTPEWYDWVKGDEESMKDIQSRVCWRAAIHYSHLTASMPGPSVAQVRISPALTDCASNQPFVVRPFGSCVR
ncbi:hypothetical protein BDZ89DRAFT_939671, partial [Hymenopellis radicata]